MAEDQYVTQARLAERAERFDDMAEFMKQRVEQNSMPLNPEERDMLSAAFKHALSGRRQAVRSCSYVAQHETAEGRGGNANLALGYKSKVEAELQEICNKALRLLEASLVPTAQDGEAKIFYLKMQGDYNRYLAEFAADAPKDAAVNAANLAYTKGIQEAAELLPAANTVRLGLALNFSVFQHETMQRTEEAVGTATLALNEARANLHSVPETQQDDVAMTMKLIQDNLSLWEQP